ncbi:hypothetical protein IH601_10085 [Candidatus Bipolaricaulota bacterium]|nr:hypothetical protein [Candidatus Bipolaricaulota bacterium]
MTEGFGMNAGDDRQSESVYRAGFIHAWISGHFQTLEDGERLFYPQGAFGCRGFAVSSTEQELILRTNVRGFQRIYSVALMILILSFSGSLLTRTSWQMIPIVIGSWPIFWLFAEAYFWSFTRTMEPVNVPNSPMAHFRSMGRTVNPSLLIGQTVFVLAITGASLYSAYQNRDPIRLLLGIFVATAIVPYVVALWSLRQMWVSSK